MGNCNFLRWNTKLVLKFSSRKNIFNLVQKILYHSSFQANVPSLFYQKATENVRFPDVFREHKNGTFFQHNWSLIIKAIFLSYFSTTETEEPYIKRVKVWKKLISQYHSLFFTVVKTLARRFFRELKCRHAVL